MTVPGDEAWNTRHRSEGPLNRADRNFAELLQELRVVFAGVPILFGFLLTLSFSERFRSLDDVQHGLFVATLGCAAMSATLIIAPVAAHRVAFQQNRKRELVRLGHRMVIAGLAAFALTLCCGVMLVLDMALGRVPAVAGAGALVLITLVLWIAVPLRLRHPSRARPRLPEPGSRRWQPSDAWSRSGARREVAGRVGVGERGVAD